MTCSDVQLACCKLCKKPIASNLGECIHCGVCNPVEKKENNWCHYLLIIFLVLVTYWAAIAEEHPSDHDGDCTTKRTQDAQDC